MSSDDQREIDAAFDGLIQFEKRLTRYALDLLDNDNADLLSPMVREAISKITHITDAITYIGVDIMDGEIERGKATCLTVLNLLLYDLEYFCRVAMVDLPVEEALIEQDRKSAEHIRTFIRRPKASFYDEIVASVFKEHVDAHGPWTNRPSKLARKLKPEIDRRASDGGKPLGSVDIVGSRRGVFLIQGCFSESSVGARRFDGRGMGHHGSASAE